MRHPLIALLLLLSGAAAATEAADELRSVIDASPESVDAVEDALGVVFMPLPVLNPTVGTGLGLVALFTYDLEPGRSPPSSTALAGGLTNTGSWVAALQQSLYWSADRFRLDLTAGKGEAHLKYYGNEDRIDLSDRPVNYRLSGWFLQPRFTVQLVRPW